MNRRVEFRLNKVSPTPHSLRANPQLDTPAKQIEVNLGQLFLHYYFDSYLPVLIPVASNTWNWLVLQLISDSTPMSPTLA
ncbi:MAG: hypothetical protein DMG38_00415 [Acidobacteria bacterium]|nr:MAG: hypothetical protein DMG38_00415 [Acidobacteriota bacterium]